MSSVRRGGGGALRFLWLAAGAAALAMVAACLVQDTSAQTSRPAKDARAASRPADPNAATRPALVTQDQFMKVIKQSCVRCHAKACTSVDALKAARWLVPGRPDASPAFKVIGVNKKAGGTYHNLSAADKQIVRDFVAQMKP